MFAYQAVESVSDMEQGRTKRVESCRQRLNVSSFIRYSRSKSVLRYLVYDRLELLVCIPGGRGQLDCAIAELEFHGPSRV